jgi:hypothetical protein
MQVQTNNTQPTMHDKKDNKKDANKDAKEETKQATTSVVAGTSTPGAIHVDALSSKGQQAFQNTPLIDGPSQWPQKRENRSDPPGLSFNRKLTKRAAASSLARRYLLIGFFSSHLSSSIVLTLFSY